MKEAIGGTWIYGIVLVFITVFITFVTVSTSYSRSYRIKDEIVLALEHYKGINRTKDGKPGSLDVIDSYLNSIGYSATGDCPDEKDWFAFQIGGTGSKGGQYGGKTNYCISKHTIVEKGKANSEGVSVNNGPIGHPESAYYSVAVFFRLDWPILRRIFVITISGETSIIQMPKDDDAYKK